MDEIINIYKELQTKFPNCKLRAATLSDIALKVRNIKNLPVVEKDIGDTWINPDDIIDGNLLCAIDKGIRNKDTYIKPLDTHLVAPYGRKLLYYGLKNLKQDLYFNLYNNVYSTNFVEWYHDDLLSRFIIEKR